MMTVGVISGVCALLVAWFVVRRTRRALPAPRPRTKIPVSEAMDRRIHTVRPDESLGDAARRLVETGQHPLPIIDGDGPVGVLTRCDVAKGLANVGEDAVVLRAPHHHAITVHPDDPIEGVADRLAHDPDAIAVVVDSGMAVGVVTPEQLATFVALHAR